jgi:hypothetical protein
VTPSDLILLLIAFCALLGIGDVLLRKVDPDNRLADWVFRR